VRLTRKGCEAARVWRGSEALTKPHSWRAGFDVVTVPDGQRGVLSRKGGPAGQPKTGQYSVDVEAFEALALPTLADDDDPSVVYILDEIGRMELHSHAFSLRVRALLARGVRLLGAITAPIYGHRVTFCDSVSASRGVVVHKLTAKVRDEVVLQLARELTDHWHAPRVAPMALTGSGPLATTTGATNSESLGRDAAAIKKHKIS